MAFEGIEFEFTRDGLTIPVTDFVPGEGIVLAGETDNWPLGVALRLEPLSPATRVMWERIQKAQGWLDTNSFRLNLSRNDVRLRFEGVRPDLLPSGTYRASLFVSGYTFHTRILEFVVPEGASVQVKVPARPERRHVRLKEVDGFDALTRGVIDRSTLDGANVVGWLKDPTRRDARKACVLNILAKLRTPVAGEPALTEGIVRLIFADIDRVYAELTPGFVDRLQASSSGFREDEVIHTTHQKLLKRIPNGSSYHLASFREESETLSMQLAVAVPDITDERQYADIDIDLGNPFTTPRGFFIHVGELLDPGKTDHLALFKKLNESRAKDFLYYDVTES